MPKRCSGENLFFLVESNQCQQFDLLSSECANIGLMSSIDSLEVGNAVTLMILETEHFSVFSLLCRIWDLWIANGQLWSRKSFVNCRWCLAIMTWKGKPSTEKRKQWLVNNEWYTGLCITNCELKENWAGNCDLLILTCESWNVNREICIEAWHCHRLGGSWRQFWSFLEPFWSLLEALGTYIGAVCKPLEPPGGGFWSVLVWYWASKMRLGAQIHDFGVRFGLQIKEKMVPNSSRNSDLFQYRFTIHFWLVFLPKMNACTKTLYAIVELYVTFICTLQFA